MVFLPETGIRTIPLLEKVMQDPSKTNKKLTNENKKTINNNSFSTPGSTPSMTGKGTGPAGPGPTKSAGVAAAAGGPVFHPKLKL